MFKLTKKIKINKNLILKFFFYFNIMFYQQGQKPTSPLSYLRRRGEGVNFFTLIAKP